MKIFISYLFVFHIIFLISCAIPVGWEVEESIVAIRQSNTGNTIETIKQKKFFAKKQYIISPEGPINRYEISKIELYSVNRQGEEIYLKFLSPEQWGNYHIVPIDDSDNWFAIIELDREKYIPYTNDLLITVFDKSRIIHQAKVVGCYEKTPGYDIKTKKSFILTPNWNPLRKDIRDYESNYLINSIEKKALFRTYNGDYLFDMQNGLLQPLKDKESKNEQ